MKNLLDKAAIIRLKQEGLSNRGVARRLGIDKKTVNKYWNQYKDNLQKLNEATDKTEISEIQENITSAPKYNSENRIRRKVTPEFLNALEKILEDEENNGTKKTEVFYPYMIYSNKDNQIIGEIELTYDQASKLNEVNRRDGVYRQDIVFLRK